MPKKKYKKSKHNRSIFEALHYSLCGLKIAYKDNQAFRQEIFLSIIIIPLALFLGENAIEKVLLIGPWILVIIVEIINSSLETTIDRISLKIHPLSKKVKDMGSAAVFVAIANAIIIWALVLLG